MTRFKVSGVDVSAYMAGKRGKKSSMPSRGDPVVRSWMLSCNVESNIDGSHKGEIEERCSDASSCRTLMGIDPFRCACSSALGMDCRKLTCAGVRLESAA